ncbi:Uncharacterised protein [Streptococcus pneumoniae]|nr:Uncharacterised protein [Streptococcus pneumoniae]
MVFEMHCRQTELIRSTALYQTVRVKLNLYPLIDFEAILLLLLYSADCAFSDKDSSFYIRCHVEVHLLTLYVIDLFRGFYTFSFPKEYSTHIRQDDDLQMEHVLLSSLPYSCGLFCLIMLS